MRVLIAEDDNASRRLLQVTLAKWGYEVIASSDGSEAWNVLEGSEAPKLVVLDWMMPGLDGVEICRRVRARTAKPYTYIILLTSKGQRGDLITALDAGADDFIAKPFDPLELKGRLRAGKRILDLQDALIRAHEELQYLATHDSLTRLWNRSAVLAELYRALARASRQQTSVAIALVDVDHFKAVNDSYGHSVGDAVLIEVARRMSTSVRPYDTVGRYGGEEFLIVFEGCNPADAVHLAERLRKHIVSDRILVGEQAISVTVSIGVAATGTWRTEDANVLVRIADVALYQAKNNGRDRVVSAPSPDASGHSNSLADSDDTTVPHGRLSSL